MRAGVGEVMQVDGVGSEREGDFRSEERDEGGVVEDVGKHPESPFWGVGIDPVGLQVSTLAMH